MNTIMTRAAVVGTLAYALLGSGPLSAGEATLRTPTEIYSAAEELKGHAYKMFACAITDDEMKMLFDDRIAKVESSTTLRPHETTLFDHLCQRCPSSVAAAYDGKFADAKVGVHPNAYKNFPLSSEVWISMNSNATASFPAWIAAIRRAKSGSPEDWTLGEKINISSERMASGVAVRPFDIDREKVIILKDAVKQVKRRIREKGESFIVPAGGANPVQKALNDLSVALNAPKMSGLETWVAEWCPGHRWIPLQWMNDADFAKLKDDVYYGSVEFTDVIKVRLCTHLGVDQYNEFVERYNGVDKQ